MKSTQNRGKVKHMRTNETEYASENNSQPNSNTFSIPSSGHKLMFPQFDDVPNTQSKKIKTQNDREDQLLSPFSVFAPSIHYNPKLKTHHETAEIAPWKENKDHRKIK